MATNRTTNVFFGSTEKKIAEKGNLQMTPSTVSIKPLSPLLLENSEKYDNLFYNEQQKQIHHLEFIPIVNEEKPIEKF